MASSKPMNRRRAKLQTRAAALGITTNTFRDRRSDAPAGPFIPRVQRSTLAAYDSALESWKNFHVEFLGRQAKTSPSDPLPSAGEIKEWIRFIGYIGQGSIGPTVTQSTVNTYWGRLRRALHKAMHKQFSKDDCRRITDFIRGNLNEGSDEHRDEFKLTACKKPKLNFTIQDVRLVLQYLWCRDDWVYCDERYRIQLALLLLLLSYSSGRPGAFVESGCHRGTNEVLLYKHCRIGLVVGNNGTAEIVLGLQMSYLKGMRGVERYMQEIPLHQTPFEFGMGMDPVTLFLALAFSDDAFDANLTPEKLLEMQQGQKCGTRWFPWRNQVLDMPVFRQLKAPGVADAANGMTYDTLRKLYHDLRGRAGFLGDGPLYGLRRGAANSLQSVVTGAELRQVMGHTKASTFAKYYASKTPYIDSQSLILGLPQRRDLTMHFQRAGCLRDERAPQELPLDMQEEIEEDPELKGRTVERAAKLDELRVKYGSISTSPQLERNLYQNLYNREWYLRKRLQKVALEKYRNSWQVKQQQTPEGLRSDTNCNRENFNEYLRIPADDLAPERLRIAVAMFGHSQANNFSELLSDLRKLCSGHFRYGIDKRSSASSSSRAQIDPSIATTEPTRRGRKPQGKRPVKQRFPVSSPTSEKLLSKSPLRTFFPAEEPISGKCRFCQLDLTQMSMGDQVQHAHDCARNVLKAALSEQHINMFHDFRCHWGQCRQFFPRCLCDVSEIAQHLQRHISNSYFVRRWDERHVNNSLSICRWGGCDMTLEKGEIRAHLKVKHGVATRVSAFPGAYCVYCFKWYHCEFEWEAHCDFHIKGLRELTCSPTFSLPGMCPFCLGDDEMVPSKRFKLFDTIQHLHRHYRGHLAKLEKTGNRTSCPHPLCRPGENEGFSLEELKTHIQLAHGIPAKAT